MTPGGTKPASTSWISALQQHRPDRPGLPDFRPAGSPPSTQGAGSAASFEAGPTLTAEEQLTVAAALWGWQTIPDEQYGQAKQLLLRYFQMPPGVDLQLETNRDSAVRVFDGRPYVLGSFVLPDARVPFELWLDTEQALLSREVVGRQLLQSAGKSGLCEGDRQQLAAILSMPEADRQVLYAATDVLDNLRRRSGGQMQELLFCGYNDHEVVVIARKDPTEEFPEGKVALFTARRNGDHFWPAAEVDEPAAFDPVTGSLRFPATGSPVLGGAAGFSVSHAGRPLQRLPTFVMGFSD